MSGGWITLMVAVAEVTPVPVACSVVFWPAVTPVTAAWTESCPAGMVTGETTLAMLVFAVASASVRPLLGAAAAMFTVMLFVVPATTLSEEGVKVTFTVTLAARLSGAKPMAVALIWALPTPTAVTWGFAAGTCEPPGMKTLGVTVAALVLRAAEADGDAAGRRRRRQADGQARRLTGAERRQRTKTDRAIGDRHDDASRAEPGRGGGDRRGARARSGDR